MKPSNIMINQTDHVVLVDFGIAKVFRIGQKGTMIGTEGYSPPNNTGERLLPWLTFILWGLLCTTRLPAGPSPRATVYLFRTSHPPNQSKLSMDMEVIVNTALQYNPSDRFQSIADMKNR